MKSILLLEHLEGLARCLLPLCWTSQALTAASDPSSSASRLCSTAARVETAVCTTIAKAGREGAADSGSNNLGC